jgi:hypothetical protein
MAELRMHVFQGSCTCARLDVGVIGTRKRPAVLGLAHDVLLSLDPCTLTTFRNAMYCFILFCFVLFCPVVFETRICVLLHHAVLPGKDRKKRAGVNSAK